MNKKYILIALLSIVNFGLADSPENTKDSVPPHAYNSTAKNLSNRELQQEYVKACRGLIEKSYNLKKSKLKYCKCQLECKNKSTCTELRKQYYDGYDDNDASEIFNAIVQEKYQRKLLMGCVGSGNSTAIIGQVNFENGQADLYRLDEQLHTKSNDELHTLQDTINQTHQSHQSTWYKDDSEEFQDYYHAYIAFVKIQELAIKRELEEPHRAEKK